MHGRSLTFFIYHSSHALYLYHERDNCLKKCIVKYALPHGKGNMFIKEEFSRFLSKRCNRLDCVLKL